MGTTPSSILITLSTNTPTFSRSGKHDFSITISATTDTGAMITIDPFWTLLYQYADVFGYQGFTFKDLSSGEHASRSQLHVCYMDREYVHPEYTVEIPSKRAAQPFTVTHSVKYIEPYDEIAHRNAAATDFEAELNELFRQGGDPVDGLEIGQKYEVALGEIWSSVGWWGLGGKGEVFGQEEKLSVYRDCKKLPLRLLNNLVFEVVE